MQFQYHTERLALIVSDESLAGPVTDYLTRNREDFEKFDKAFPEEFYTVDYQKELLVAEQRLFLKSAGVRFYMFLKDDPDRVIGNVSFAYLNEENGHRCSIGYKIDIDYRRQGYAYEAASFLLPIIFREYRIHRIEADILPDNEPSLALIRKLGFEYEGIARKSHEIAGVDRDHCRFSFIT